MDLKTASVSMHTTNPSSESLIFIGGSGRSGTTLMRSLISAHPRLAIAPETHFMKIADRNGGLKEGQPTRFQKFWKRYSSSTRFKDLGVDPSHCIDLMNKQEGQTYRNIFRAMLTAYGKRLGKERVGEKTPSHVRYVSQLLEWFPDARVIVMRRDPRAIIASKMNNPWVTRRLTPTSLRHGLLVGHRLYEIAREIKDWVELYEDIVVGWEQDDRVLIVSYEALVSNVENELKRICGFLGEPYEPAMLRNRTSETVPEPEGEVFTDRLQEWRKQHHAKTLQPISDEGLGKWKERLTRTEIAMIEGGTLKGMLACGYDPSTTRLQRAQGKALYGGFYGMGSVEAGARSWARSVLKAVRTTSSATQK